MRQSVAPWEVSASGIVGATFFLSQPSGNCVGFETWPTDPTLPLDPTQIFYGYGTLPATPDANPFMNGSDPNVIATFTSVFDKKNYGVLVDANQNWVAKVNLGNLSAQSFTPLPAGQDISGQILAGAGGNPVVYLPAAGAVDLSPTLINFGSQSISTANPTQIEITLTNPGTTALLNTHIGIQASGFNNFVLQQDFTQSNNCGTDMPPQEPMHDHGYLYSRGHRAALRSAHRYLRRD